MNSYFANPRIRRRSGAPIFWAYTLLGGRQTFPGDTGDVFDLVGRTPAGTRGGGCTWVDGPAGRVLSTGSDSVDFGTSDLFNFTASDFTISFWCNPTTVSVPWVPIGRGLFQSAGWYVLVNGSAITLTCNASGTNYDLITTSTPMAVNVAQHIVAVRSGTSGAIYWNGVAQPVSGTLASPASYPGQHLYLNRYSGGGDSITATIWDLKIYDYALSASQVAADFVDPYLSLRSSDDDDMPAWLTSSASPYAPGFTLDGGFVTGFDGGFNS
jgi:hypothetical protein